MTLKAASVAASVRCLLAGLSLALRPSAGVGTGSRGRGWPANVRAVYDINFNGFNVGTFEFQSQAEQRELHAARQRQALRAARRLHLGSARPAASA